MAQNNNDAVNHPSHYTDGKIEVIDYIEDKGLGFNLGNTVKYISRAGKKDGNSTLQDLKKASWYLDREIANIEKAAYELAESKLPKTKPRPKKQMKSIK